MEITKTNKQLFIEDLTLQDTNVDKTDKSTIAFLRVLLGN